MNNITQPKDPFFIFKENSFYHSQSHSEHNQHHTGYTRFVEDIANKTAKSVNIEYSEKSLPVANVKLLTGDEYEVTLPTNNEDIKNLLTENKINVDFSMKDKGVIDSLRHMFKILYEESLAPLIAIGGVAGIYFGFKNTFDKIQKQIDFRKFLKQAPEQILTENNIKDILEGLDESTSEHIRSVRDMLLNHNNYRESKIIFMQGPPCNRKNFFS